MKFRFRIDRDALIDALIVCCFVPPAVLAAACLVRLVVAGRLP